MSVPKWGWERGEQRHELSSSLVRKKKLRRYLREMEREGPVTFAHLQSWEEIEKALPGFAEAHVERFRATGRVSSLAEPQRRRFLEELAKRFDGAGVVTLSVLKIQDRPVAWNYGFRFHGSWFWYQPTFDSRHEQNSPGYCLLARIVIDACDQEGNRTSGSWTGCGRLQGAFRQSREADLTCNGESLSP